MANSAAETVIGAAVLAVAGVFLVYASQATSLDNNGTSYEVTAKFRKAGGLSVGSDVRVSGVKVGAVKSLELDPKTYFAAVELNIRSAILVPEDSSARISSEGLLGSNYVEIEPGGSEDMLTSGDEIQMTQGSINFLDIISKAIHGATESQ